MFFDASISQVGIALVGSCLGFLLLLACSRKSTRKTLHKFPPSPPVNSLAGHCLPEKSPFLVHESWFEQYGPLISIRAGIDRHVVIGRHKAAIEIMEKQGSALVDQPRMVAGGELLSGGLRMIVTPAGERFKRMRRALHTHLQPRAVKTYQSIQVSHAKRLLLGLIESPARYEDHATAYAVSVILKLTYGRDANTDASHPDVLELRRSLRRFGTTLCPGFYLVDSLPWLKYLPWYGRDLRRGFIEDRSLFHRALDAVKSQMSDPNSGPSFAKFLLAREVDFGLDETEMAFLAGSLVSAGWHTTALSICIVMMAAALHPDAQAAVHAELDAVVGSGRLPAFDDEGALPSLCAFVLESMRWRPLTALGVAHRATEDIIWGNYHIPAGTTVLGNHWAISRDPEVFPDPDRFDMSRWLTLDKKVRDDLKFPHFGFGRRICPGQHVATTSIYINTAFILWAFDISVDESKPIDDLGFLDDKTYPIGLHFKPRIPAETLKEIIQE